MNNDAPTSLCLKALPEGGFAVAGAPYDAPAHWLAAFSTIDEALRFIRNRMLPVPRDVAVKGRPGMEHIPQPW